MPTRKPPDDSAPKPRKRAKKKPPVLPERDSPQSAKEYLDGRCTSEDCKWEAWRLYAEGTFAFNALALAVNRSRHADHPNCPHGPHNNHWAERAIDYCGRAVAEAMDRGGPTALAQLLQGYQADIQAQLYFATQGTQAIRVKVERYGDNGKRTLTEERVEQVPDFNLRSLARSRVTEIRAKQAAALGVATSVARTELTGANGGPVQTEVVNIDAGAVLADEELLRLAAGVVGRASGRPFEPGEPGGADDAG